MKPRIPEHFELFDDEDRPFKVRFDYDEGEEQWFDARAGVGSPGSDPSVAITEVDFGCGWEPVETYPQLNIAECEQCVMDKINDLYEAMHAERDEREYE